MSLSAPFALWQGPPEHHATCVAASGGSVVTGSREGGLCLWRRGQEARPVALMCNHEAPISCVCACTCYLEPAFASVSLDGSLTVWERASGACLSSAAYTVPFAVTSMCAVSGERLVLAGRDTDLHVFDLRTMSMERVIHSGHTDWISAMDTVKQDSQEGPDRGDWCVISVSRDCCMWEWSASSSVAMSQMDVGSPAVGVSCSRNRVLVVCERSWTVLRKADYALVSQGTLSDEDASSFVGGSVLPGAFVLLYTDDGRALTYNYNPVVLPSVKLSSSSSSFPSSSAAVPAQGGSSAQKKKKIAPNTRLQLVSPIYFLLQGLGLTAVNSTPMMRDWQTIMDRDAFPWHPDMDALSADSSSGGAHHPHHHPLRPASAPPDRAGPPSTKSSSPGAQGAGGSGRGIVMSPSLSMLRVTSTEDVDAASSVLVSVLCTPWRGTAASTCWCVDSGEILATSDVSAQIVSWAMDSACRVSLPDSEECPQVEPETSCCIGDAFDQGAELAGSPVTSNTVFVGFHQPVYITGHEDGTVQVQGVLDSERRVIPSSCRRRVTALLTMSAEECGRDYPLVIWGADDFSVRVHNLKSGAELAVFCCHAGSIQSLVKPYVYSSSSSSSSLSSSSSGSSRSPSSKCFCSVGADNNVVLYSLVQMECVHVFGGHTSPLLQLYWRLGMDLLVVKCLLGEVYFWELSTGTLERKATGQTANELLSQWEGMATFRHTNYWFSEQRQGRVGGGSSSGQGHRVLESDHVRTGRVGMHPSVCVLNVNVSQLLSLVSSDTFERILLDYKSQRQESRDWSNWRVGASLLFSQATMPEHLLGHLPSLGITPLGLRHTVAFRGHWGSYTLYFPLATSGACGPFSLSPTVSASVLVSCTAVLKSLMRMAPIGNRASELFFHYSVNLGAQAGPDFQPPSPVLLASCLADHREDIQHVAWAHLQSMASQLESSAVPDLLQHLYCMATAHRDETTRNALLIVMGMILSCHPETSFHMRSQVTVELSHLCEGSSEFQAFAISILAQGYHTWQYYIPDTPRFIQTLFRLSIDLLLAKGAEGPEQVAASERFANPSAQHLAKEAVQALLAIADENSKEFVETVLLGIINSSDKSSRDCLATLELLARVREHNTMILLPHLQHCCATLITCLDPNQAAMRERCLPHIRMILRNFVNGYPMTSLHLKTQKFAVGCTDGRVVIFDLRLAAKWQVIHSFESPITALAFSPDGNYVAIFSYTDATLHVCSFTSAGIFSLLGGSSSSGKAIRSYPIPGCSAGGETSAGPSNRRDSHHHHQLVYRFVTLDWPVQNEIQLSTSQDSKALCLQFEQ